MPGRGTEKRQATTTVRVTPATKVRLAIEAGRRNVPMSDLIEALLPNERWKVSACRYCGVTVRQPTLRHRWHALGCVLWAEKGYKGDA
jgi:hypothetical protein